MTTYEKVLKIIKENELVDSEVEITPEKNLIFDLHFDSVKLMGLLFEIEQEFDISIINDTSNYKFFTVETIPDIVTLIDDLLL
ncbi:MULTISPECIES: acyl carrier protein [Fusobacterium]|jgi:phosphopantetheine attachment domain protein|uniref:Acyl carrier protein n=2 Tax=Fusobacterium TaxID=848 RepID=A0A2D3PS75_9FUSO|nr:MULTISPECIES: phosphopantetheine-binding protein [Fusobacterium]ATV69684.1 acyl carrier protein [Fusobacterium pseudoperiodonticum]PHI11894.1 acyl carrier protein [Fusobacterium polymorphum]